MSTGYVQVPSNGGGGSVESVTGSAVDNTDPANPVINSTGGAILGADNFTSTGGGASPALVDEDTGSTFVALGVTKVDVWLNQAGEQGVKIPTADYTYTAGTGVITGLQASKNYTAYGR